MYRWLVTVAIVVVVGTCISPSVVEAHPITRNSTTSVLNAIEHAEVDDDSAEIARIVGGEQAAVGEYPYFGT